MDRRRACKVQSVLHPSLILQRKRRSAAASHSRKAPLSAPQRPGPSKNLSAPHDASTLQGPDAPQQPDTPTKADASQDAAPQSTAYPAATGPRRYTVSVALPGSIVANAQGLELKTLLAGQIARALATFSVDEVVVFDDSPAPRTHAAFEAHGGASDPCVFLVHLLRYIETPHPNPARYLRKALFPIHRDLRFAGLLNPLDAPHHLRADQHLPYREGITLAPPPPPAPPVPADCTLVDAGLRRRALVAQAIRPGLRVTLALDAPHTHPHYVPAAVVSPAAPRKTMGYYWGYAVRFAPSLSAVFLESPHRRGYDLTIGTSERGVPLDDVVGQLPRFHHLLVVFGGLAGLEAAVHADDRLAFAADAPALFDAWVNVCPAQGCRTIRTEEALPITLAQLRTHIARCGI
ncbi:hypothetical protein PMAC_002756 [Pneumocystis sp. 'macacae']|nr:hypothetical protein PMAC_002756 [Pneumocystis sp. 'macacae']